MKIVFTLFTILLLNGLFAQTFTGGTGPILDNQTIDIPLTVSVPQTSINTTTFGVETICLNLTHTYLADLTIQIVAPDGTIKNLASGIGGGDDDMTNTCFNANATTSISAGTAPFTGTFIPMGQMGAVNNGQNPNGTWYLRVSDNYGADEGILIDWTLTFGSAPADYFEFSESDLPIVVINTNGNTIDYDIKVTADMGIVYNGPGNRNHLIDPFNEYNGKIGIEYRGNYSLSLPQKPYSIELIDNLGVAIDSSIFGMPAENDWLLLANYNDKSFARNALPNETFESMGNYGVRSHHVDVVLNGEYQGIYLFSEKVKRDSNRVDISKLDTLEILGQDVTGGYIIKVDYWDNTDSWQSNFSPIGFPGLDIHYVYYYPKPDVIVLEQQTYIQNFMDEFETALYAANFDDPNFGYRRYISVPTFVDYLIINELARNVDGYKKSRFLYKDKDHADGTYRKLKAGPVWDFDWALKDMWSGAEDGSGFMYSEVDQDVNAPGWYIRLLQDTLFANEVRCRYDDLRRNILSEAYMHNKIDSIAAVVNESQDWHYLTWGHMGAATGTGEVQAPSQTYAEEVQRLKDWLTRRVNWLDINMPGTLNGCSFAGLEEISSVSFEVYPNPFSSTLYLNFENKNLDKGQILMRDAAGRIVSQFSIDSPQLQEQVELTGLGELQSGIYFVEVQLGTRKSVQKVVK
ncbi:MAG: CotH kinase family protein [Crocinitomicaceae bacterium]|nr:CotH kinase family protein [Crocinitomicaceae bacterium]MCF8433290.1 CotH kinase family protein [Crocinitomicaceae bacterium]